MKTAAVAAMIAIFITAYAIGASAGSSERVVFEDGSGVTESGEVFCIPDAPCTDRDEYVPAPRWAKRQYLKAWFGEKIVWLKPGQVIQVVLPKGSTEDDFCLDYEPEGFTVPKRHVVEVQAIHWEQCNIEDN